MTQQFHVEVNVRLSLLIQNSPGERVRKLKAMFARGTMVSMQLSPLVSMKSWRVMAVGSMWCSLNGRIKACRTDQTGCQTGNSTQCKCGKMFRVFITQTNDSILGRNRWEIRLWLPSRRWADPLIPTCRLPSEQVRTQSLPWVFLPLKTREWEKWEQPTQLGKTEEHCIIFLTNAQQDVPQMSQVEIGKKVNEIEGHEREAEDDTYPFLTSFALKEKHHD